MDILPTPEMLYPVFCELAKKLTHNDSSSIPYNKALQLMASITYCFEEPHDALVDLLPLDSTTNFEMQYQSGLKRKKQKLIHSKSLFSCILDFFNSYQNICYQDTILKGLPEFFNWYDVELDARNHLLTLDYPLFHPLPNYCGIDLIYDYLVNLHIEVIFLSQLPQPLVNKILCDYHPNYNELIFNIPNIILRHLFCCQLLNVPNTTTIFNSSFLNQLQSIVLAHTSYDLESEFALFLTALLSPLDSGRNKSYSTSAHINLSKDFVVSTKNMFEYFFHDVQTLINELIVCTKHNCFSQFF